MNKQHPPELIHIQQPLSTHMTVVVLFFDTPTEVEQAHLSATIEDQILMGIPRRTKRYLISRFGNLAREGYRFTADLVWGTNFHGMGSNPLRTVLRNGLMQMAPALNIDPSQVDQLNVIGAFPVEVAG